MADYRVTYFLAFSSFTNNIELIEPINGWMDLEHQFKFYCRQCKKSTLLILGRNANVLNFKCVREKCATGDQTVSILIETVHQPHGFVPADQGAQIPVFNLRITTNRVTVVDKTAVRGRWRIRLKNDQVIVANFGPRLTRGDVGIDSLKGFYQRPHGPAPAPEPEPAPAPVLDRGGLVTVSLRNTSDNTSRKQQRLLAESHLYGTDALNVIACEGIERIERPETYRQWQSRNERSGFWKSVLEEEVVKRVQALVLGATNES